MIDNANHLQLYDVRNYAKLLTVEGRQEIDIFLMEKTDTFCDSLYMILICHFKGNNDTKL